MGADTGCVGVTLPAHWWRDADLLRREHEAHGTWAAVRDAHPDNCPSTRVLQDWWRRCGFPPLPPGPKPAMPVQAAETEDDLWLIELLKQGHATVEELADRADVAPRKVREALARLREDGYRVDTDEHHVRLLRVAPGVTNLHPGLFDGTDLVLGVVSDTHLGSEGEALAELELAYDMFRREGVTRVLHAGDITCGLNVFRGQHAEAKVHTLDQVVEYAVERYPRREGIETLLIGGNHDLEGDAAKVGLDLAAAVAAKRDDVRYLGPMSAWLGVGDDEETAPWIHLLHGKGGMSYSYSYKAQKLVDGYPAGRKPAILIPGHWHVRGSIEHRSVEVLWPGCFEWQSTFMARLGLHPAVGFHVLHARFGPDGSLVRFQPLWYRFHAGRVIG